MKVREATDQPETPILAGTLLNVSVEVLLKRAVLLHRRRRAASARRRHTRLQRAEKYHIHYSIL